MKQKAKGPWFFIGVAGSGMSALAQFLAFRGEMVAGSDRDFELHPDSATRQGLVKAGIRCFPQNGSGLTPEVATVVYSTAIEPNHPELLKAQQFGATLLHRSELLAQLSSSMETIAVAGTSGKSTTAAMIFHILSKAGLQPSLISGAGLIELEEEGWIGNAWGGRRSDKTASWLVIEADESDGSIVHYHPKIGVLLNIDRDHKEPEELRTLFATFAAQSQQLIVNLDNAEASRFSRNSTNDFSLEPGSSALSPAEQRVRKEGGWSYRIGTSRANLTQPGLHNLSNAMAAITAARAAGVSTAVSMAALSSFRGIWRRYQRVGTVNNIALVDDFAHNPAKIAAALATAQSEANRVLAWFQPHGFAPTRFMRHELAQTLQKVMRPQDQIWFSDIHYAGGTVTRNISSADLAADGADRGYTAHFAADRQQAAKVMIAAAEPGDLILLMGARDPTLDQFARDTFAKLKAFKVQ